MKSHLKTSSLHQRIFNKIGSLFILPYMLLCSFFVLSPVQAEKLSNLYQAQIAVVDQSEAQRSSAMANGLRQVLIRASGSASVLDDLDIRHAVSDAQSYMRQYSYQALSFEEQRIYGKPLLLKLNFDSVAIANLLKASNQPIWSSDRPSGVFWIGVETSDSRNIVQNSSDETAISLRANAKTRGLPVSLPLMDLEDSEIVSVSDVWGRFLQPIKQASRRYQADYVVVGQLTQANGQWKGRWSVGLGTETKTLTTSGMTQNETIAGLVNRVTDLLASRLAVVLSDEVREYALQIENVDTVERYAAVVRFLNQLTVVKSAQAVELESDRVVFKIEALSSEEHLIRAIEIGNNLRRVDFIEQNPNDSNLQRFRWVD